MPKHDDVADYHAIKQPLVDVRVGQANMKHVARLPRLILPLWFFALVFASVHVCGVCEVGICIVARRSTGALLYAGAWPLWGICRDWPACRGDSAT